MGQKRFFLKQFIEVLKQFRGKVDTVVDLFGGSGLLSHTAKQVLPECRVIYNDFDGYTRRLAAMPETNDLLAVIRSLLVDVAPEARVPEEIRRRILELVDAHEAEYGYVDRDTLVSALLFSARDLGDLKKDNFYNNVPRSYLTAPDYLEGVETVRGDFREIAAPFQGDGRVLFILDPPYLSTSQDRYKSQFASIAAAVDPLEIFIKERASVYFTSSRSELPDLLGWLDRGFPELGALRGVQEYRRVNHISNGRQYNDIMLARVPE